ncbi:hypothetical protein [Sphingobacterium sp. R2]|uniref:hypothetical protein n=1 Tax=Sphingobacterium sp. R2 TaxID=3112958 RepID=UPI00345D7539
MRLSGLVTYLVGPGLLRERLKRHPFVFAKDTAGSAYDQGIEDRHANEPFNQFQKSSHPVERKA